MKPKIRYCERAHKIGDICLGADRYRCTTCKKFVNAEVIEEKEKTFATMTKDEKREKYAGDFPGFKTKSKRAKTITHLNKMERVKKELEEEKERIASELYAEVYLGSLAKH